jgi:hypothetical protein
VITVFPRNGASDASTCDGPIPRTARSSFELVLVVELELVDHRRTEVEDGVQTPQTKATASQPDAASPQAEAPVEGEKPKIPDEDLRDPQRTVTGTDLEDAEFPGSWPMFGKNTRMKIGGYVKADFLYDFDGTTDRNQFLMSTIPLDGTPEAANSGYVSLFARETRFNIDVRRIEEDRAPLRLFVEGDFWASSSQFRLRHAYVVFGKFLAGQTWTTLSILESLVYMIDFGAGDALFGGRTAAEGVHPRGAAGPPPGRMRGRRGAAAQHRQHTWRCRTERELSS